MRVGVSHCIAIIALGALAGACGSDGKEKLVTDNIGASPGAGEQATGCVQGVVVNGLTRQRVQLTPDTVGNQIFVITPNGALRAQLVKSLVGNDAGVDGEYFICGIPILNDFPLYVRVNGYQEFYADVNSASAVPGSHQVPLPNNLTVSKFWSIPVQRYDIRLFPLSELARDYTVTVTFKGEPVANARVNLVPAPGNGSPGVPGNPASGTFATAQDLRMSALAGTTDESGVATFDASKLVFGGRYDVTVQYADVASAEGPTLEAGTVRTGVTVGDDDIPAGGIQAEAGPFSLAVDIASNAWSGTLTALASTDVDSNGDVIVTPDGAVSILFSRPLAFPQGGLAAGAITAAITDAGDGADGNACTSTFTMANPSVTSTIVGNRLTLSPKVTNASQLAAAVANCKGVELTYTVALPAQLQDAGRPSIVWDGEVGGVAKTTFMVRLTNK